jgi:hypothetical protein
MLPAFALWRAVEADSATPDLDARPHGVDGQWSRFVRPGATTTTSEFAGYWALSVVLRSGEVFGGSAGRGLIRYAASRSPFK